MRKIASILATLASCMLLTGMASAQADISNTGPGSNNSVTVNESTNYNCNSSNQATIVNNSQQQSDTGSASVTGNTTGGGANSGSSSNNNTTNTSVTATNSCTTGTTTAVSEGGNGGGAVLGESTSGGVGAGVVVSSLPATGEVSTAQYAAGISAAITGLGLFAYVLRSVLVRNRALWES